MSRSWSGGSTRRWRRVRRDVLLANANENRGRCQLDVGKHCQRHNRPCRGVCTGKADTAHHVRGKAFGDRPEDVIATCAACNLHIGNPSAGAVKHKPISNW